MSGKTYYIHAPHAAGETLTAQLNGQEPVTKTNYGVPDEGQDPVVLQAMGGRWAEYDEDIVSVDFGTVKKQMDGKTLIDFCKVYSPRTVNGVTASGQPVIINVSQRYAKDTFGPATYYMLETDEATGDVIVEPGDYSRDIYISNAPTARTLAMIAAEQDPPIAESAVTGAWLLARPQYGGSPEMKITTGVASRLIAARYSATSGDDRIKPSDIHYFERGYDYTGFEIDRLQHGESPLHPRQFRAFGTGSEPTGVKAGGNKSYFPTNWAFVGVPITFGFRNQENTLIADATFQEEVGYDSEQGAYLTLYRPAFFDIAKDVPNNGATWSFGKEDREQGFFHSGLLGGLVWGAAFDHNGWAEPYEINGTFDPVTAKQPPSIYSHNMYLGEFYNHDVTWEDIISIRASSIAGQMRPGGLTIGCVGIENPGGWQNQGRVHSDPNGTRGSWPITIKTVSTLGVNRPYINNQNGAKTKAFDFEAAYPAIIDTLAIHAGFPREQVQGQGPVGWGTGAAFNNHVEIDWKADQNTAGLDLALAETITIENWATQRIGEPSTKEDYYAYLRTLTYSQRHAEIKAANRYFLSAREGNMLLPLEERTEPETLGFRVNPLGEGFRSDNPLNWTSGDTPINGDSIDLHGNRMVWVKETRSLNALNVGAGGVHEGSSGKVSYESMVAGGKVKVSHSHKLYIANFDGDAEVRGGRFMNIGNGQGNIDASGQGETVLGNFTVGNGQKARICGDMGKFGWDAIAPTGDLIIEDGGTLEFHATPIIKVQTNAQQINLGKLEGGTSGATGFFDSWRRKDYDAFVRVRDLVGTPVIGETSVKANPDETDPLIKTGSTILDILPARIGKIETGWRGRIGAATGATHNVVLQAGSNLVISNRNLMAPGTYDLTGPGITVTNPGNITLPAGVTLTGGKLVLTVN